MISQKTIEGNLIFTLNYVLGIYIHKETIKHF